MTEREPRYTIKEIAEASGINAKTLNSRAKRLRAAGIFPKIMNRSVAFYTYDQAKELIRKPRQVRCQVRPVMVDQLKLKLKTDGYRIATTTKKEDNNGDIP